MIQIAMIDNNLDNQKEELGKEEHSSTTSEILNSGILEAPLEFGRVILDTIKEKTQDLSQSGITENISEALESTKEFISENGGELIEGVGKVAGSVIEGIGDIIGSITD